MKLPRSHVLTDFSIGFYKHISRIKPSVHLHGGYTTLFLTVEHAPLNRRGTSVSRKKRSMDINTAVFRQIKNILRNDLAVSHYDYKLGVKLLQNAVCSAVLHLCRLKNGNIIFDSLFLYGRKLHFMSPALRLIRLSKNSDNLVTVCNKSFKTRNGKLGRSHKYNSHQRQLLLSVIL